MPARKAEVCYAPFWLEKDQVWAVDFTVDGLRIRRRLGIRENGKKGEKVAIEVAKQLYFDTLEAALLSAEEDTPDSDPFFFQAAALYVQGGGSNRYLTRIMKHLGPTVRLSDLTPFRIEQIGQELQPGCLPDTVRRHVITPIKAVLNFAAGKRRRASEDNSRKRWLTPEEAERLIYFAANPHLAKLRDPDLHTLKKIAFMLGTGAGPGETVALPASGWNPATQEWWCPGEKTIYRERWVWLPQRSIDLIGEVPKEGRAFRAPDGAEYVLHDHRGGQMAEAFNKVRDAAGLGPDVVPYTLRHTWATWFYAQTGDWGRLLDLGGWHKGDTARRYKKVAPADLGNRLLAHGWDFRQKAAAPVRFGELVSV